MSRNHHHSSSGEVPSMLANTTSPGSANTTHTRSDDDENPPSKSTTSPSEQMTNEKDQNLDSLSDKASGGAQNGQRKRTARACDRCSLARTKCDGKNPCYRCASEYFANSFFLTTSYLSWVLMRRVIIFFSRSQRSVRIQSSSEKTRKRL